ncbi:hypothetical protein Tco_0165342, partial [Tanacetum coccineum]
VRESPDAPMVEKLVSDDKLEKKTIFLTVAKIEVIRVLSRAIGVSSRVRKGKGAIAFWVGPNLVVWARYAFWLRGHVAINCRSKKKS